MLWQSYDRLTLPDAAAARRRVRPAVARHRAGDDAARPAAQLVEFAGVGHAPMLVQPEQRAVVREFLLARPVKTRHEDDRAAAPRPRRRSCSWPTRKPDPTPAARTAPARWSRARAFAEPLLAGQLLDTGEDALAHADGVAAMLQAIGAAPTMRAAAYLVYAGDYLQRPEEVVAKAFGPSYAQPGHLHAQAGADPARRACGAGRGRHSAPSRPSVCARCCWPSRATCAWCCCGWPRGCRRCAGSRPASSRARATGRRIAAGLRAAGQPAGHLADQVGDGGPVLPLPAARRLQAHRAAARREAHRARGRHRGRAHAAGAAAG